MFNQKLKIGILLQFAIVFVTALTVYAQTMEQWNRLAGIPLFMDSLNYQANFYDRQNNIAALIEDENKKSLWLGINSANLFGDFRLPFEPEQKNDLNFAVRTVYPLSEKDIFKGTFTYQRHADKSILWVHQNRNLGENPFLLGDSSRGDFDLRGLAWSAEWSHRFHQSISAGLGFHYLVDQRLKQIFPKPLNKHRDMKISAGLQFAFSDWKIGLQYVFISEQEKVEITKYSLNQDLTPILFKFRYSDLPVILRGQTSEERKVEDETSLFGLQLSHIWEKLFVIGSFQYKIGSSSTIDGGSRGKAEGTYDRREYLTTVQAGYDLPGMRFFLNYHGHAKNIEAFHPDFGFTVLQYPLEKHRVEAGVSYAISNIWKLFTELSFEDCTQEKNDMMTNNYWRIDRRFLTVNLGLNTHLNATWETNFWFGYRINDYPQKERSYNQYTNFYEYLFEQPFYYFSGKKNNYFSGFQLIYHYLPVLDVEIFTSYAQQNGKMDLLNAERTVWTAAIITKLYIF